MKSGVDELTGPQQPGGPGRLPVYIGGGPQASVARRSNGLQASAGQRAPGHPQPALSLLLRTPAQSLPALTIALVMSGAARHRSAAHMTPRASGRAQHVPISCRHLFSLVKTFCRAACCHTCTRLRY